MAGFRPGDRKESYETPLLNEPRRGFGASVVAGGGLEEVGGAVAGCGGGPGGGSGRGTGADRVFDSTAISIPGVMVSNAPATPYPSIINVPASNQAVADINVSLNGLTHSLSREVDVLLVGPQGHQVMVLSDAGNNASNVSFSLDDEAAAPVPVSGTLASGTYKPTDYEVGETLPAPAPAGPYSSQLSAFDGTDPSGEWKLFVADDTFDDGGTFAGGWSLTITTAPLPTITVNSTADSNNGCNTTECTLREAIGQANTTPGRQRIAFAIPGDGPHQIVPATALPTITDAVFIDGYSQTGASPNTLAQGSNATLKIELSGTTLTTANATANFLGMTLGPGAGSSNGIAQNSTISGLCINRFQGAVVSSGANSTDAPSRIVGCFLGTEVAGTVDRGNTNDGAAAVSGAEIVVGREDVADRNVISGNNRAGVYLESTGDSSVVLNSIIGLNAAGNSVLPNKNGVYVFNTPRVVVGGTSIAARNVISGNSGSSFPTSMGVFVTGAASTGVVIRGNFIGTDASGALDRGNGSSGVRIESPSCVIGGPQAGASNVISGNDSSGVVATAGATGLVIQNNIIGLDAGGTIGRGNLGSGVFLLGSGIQVGGTGAGQGNVISANGSNGISVNNGTLGGHIIQGNLIGTNAAGTEPRGNVSSGISILDGANTLIGGATPAARNVIAGNGGSGISIVNPNVTGTVIQNNFIGVAADGATAVGNASNGISIGNRASNTLIGGSASTANVIAFNAAVGVTMNGDGAVGNAVLFNSITPTAGWASTSLPFSV
jgi:CSLREA domain-containing protein